MNETILVVDDEPKIVQIARDYLEGSGFKVLSSGDGKQALALARQEKPDLILFCSMYHGGLMQGYWAYSCRSHFVGAIAGRGTRSEIRNPLGEVVASNTNYFDFTVATVNLDCELVHLDYNWGRLRKMKAKYGPKVKISDPAYLGSVLISSEHDAVSVDDMIEEFKIELLDDYFTRALAYQHKHRGAKNEGESKQ